MNIEQPLEKMTWGELRAFVALGEHLDSAEEVVFEVDGDFARESMVIIGYTVFDFPSTTQAVNGDGS